MLKGKKSIAMSALTLCLAASFAGNAALSASACDLTADELFEKYGYLCEIYTPLYASDSLQSYAQELTGAEYVPVRGEVIESGCENGFLYDLLDNGSIRVTGLAYDELPEDTEVLQIPAEIAGYPVQEIGYKAFMYARDTLVNLREVILPDSVELIAERAFSCVFGNLLQNPVDDETKQSFRLNIPANVQYIGYRAYIQSAFALVNGQETRVIHLPESLEYISSQAFDDAVGGFGCAYGRAHGKIEIDMPDSLVFMSDDTFHTDRGWSGFSRSINAFRTAYILPENLPEEDIALLQSEYGNGFLNGERNIVSMKELLWAFLDNTDTEQGERIFEKPITYDKLYVDTYEVWAVDEEGCLILDENGYPVVDHVYTSIERLRELAAQNAPELFAAAQETQAKPETAAAYLPGDLNTDGAVDICDAVLLNRLVAADTTVQISDAGMANADVDADGLLTGLDVTEILQQIAKLN